MISSAIVKAEVMPATNKINLPGIDRLEKIRQSNATRANKISNVEAIVSMNDGWDSSRFDELNIKITSRISENIIIVKIPTDRVENFAALEEVNYVEIESNLTPKLDKARQSANVNGVHDGFTYEDTFCSFTGEGVVTGLFDIGIDPNHINFKDENGKSRVKYICHLTGWDGEDNSYSGEDVNLFTTDDENEDHGTHVAGIMSGSYDSDGVYAAFDESLGRGVTNKGNIPYKGIATESDIVMVTGDATNTNILKGINSMISYAKSKEMPAVINVSFGENGGSGDGSSYFERSLSDLAKDAIICVSAGNEGDRKICIQKRFTASNTQIKSFITYRGEKEYHGIDIWGDDDTPMGVKLALYNRTLRRTIDLAEINKPWEEIYCHNGMPDAINNENIDGEFRIMSEISQLNQRYHAFLSLSFSPKNGGYETILIIEGKDGQKVTACLTDEDSEFVSYNITGFSDGTPDGSINEMACAEDVISVGSYTSRNSWAVIDDVGEWSYGNQKLEEVSDFSSFGTTFSGESLPTICAPGSAIISSLNRYKTATSDNVLTSASVSVSGDKLTHYWGAKQGTSMSCPFAAGTFALWLEADPTLTAREIKDIIKAVAVNPYKDSANASTDLRKRQWGGGKLDAMAGLKEVLRRKYAGVGDVYADNDKEVFVSNLGGNRYNVSVGYSSKLEISVYSINGTEVFRNSCSGNEMEIDVSGMPAGIYIMTVNTPATSFKPVRLRIR